MRFRRFLKLTGLTATLFFMVTVYQNCGNYRFSQNNDGAVVNKNNMSCNTDTFLQPQATITNSVDILFVVHTTSSFGAVRQTVVNGLNKFIQQLPAGADYQIGVMPAHSPRATPTSGYLYSPSGVPKVLSSQQLSQTDIITDLGEIMTNMPGAKDANGNSLEDGTDEEGLASLYTAMDSTHFAAGRALNFFRPNAALAVVLLANEADMCGLFDAPIGNYSPQNTDGDNSDTSPGSELSTAKKDCLDANGNPLITPVTVYNRILANEQMGGTTNPFLIGGVVYTNPAQQPGSSEEEYGWGYVDLITLDSGPAVDINSDIPTGLAKIGQMTSTVLNLKTNFAPTENNIDPTTISVSVDGTVTTGFTYQPAINDVNIPSPGHAGSTIKISYCQLPSG